MPDKTLTTTSLIYRTEKLLDSILYDHSDCLFAHAEHSAVILLGDIREHIALNGEKS